MPLEVNKPVMFLSLSFLHWLLATASNTGLFPVLLSYAIGSRELVVLLKQHLNCRRAVLPAEVCSSRLAEL